MQENTGEGQTIRGRRIRGRQNKTGYTTTKPPTNDTVAESRPDALVLSFSFYGSSKPIEGSELPEQQPISVIFVLED